MTNYSIGRSIEYRARDAAKKAGYSVIRAAGSKGIFDLCCWNSERHLHVQCKLLGAASKQDYVEIRQAPRPPGTAVELWEWDRTNGDWIVHQLKNGIWRKRIGLEL